MAKIFYIGAGHHIGPVLDLPNFQEFVFSDTLPRSDGDSDKWTNKDAYHKKFVKELLKKTKQYEFDLIEKIILNTDFFESIISDEQKKYYENPRHGYPPDVNPTLLIFKNNNNNKILKYYISTNLKLNRTPELIMDIQTSEGMIVSGYWAQREVLDYIVNPIAFYGYNTTNFTPTMENLMIRDNRDFYTKLYFSEDKNESLKYFNSYYYVDTHIYRRVLGHVFGNIMDFIKLIKSHGYYHGLEEKI
jgi:hypothetical protein